MISFIFDIISKIDNKFEINFMDIPLESLEHGKSKESILIDESNIRNIYWSFDSTRIEIHQFNQKWNDLELTAINYIVDRNLNKTIMSTLSRDYFNKVNQYIDLHNLSDCDWDNLL